jgi:peptidoglycan/LPS O-acetylase OafA/YrhL
MTTSATKQGVLSAPSRSEFRPDIEGLRGLAILLVVLFHACNIAGWPLLFAGGFVGVDLFFVISGFLITGLLLKEYEQKAAISLTRFYARRARRILPAALVVLLISFPLTFWLLPPLGQPSALLDGISASLSIGNIRLALTTNYFNQVSASPFLHFWSLGVEEQFYLIWPALLIAAAILGRKIARGHADWGILALLIFIIIASFIGNLALSDYFSTLAFYLLPTRAWQLALGGLLAFLGTKPLFLRRAQAYFRPTSTAFYGWTGLGALFISALILDLGLRPIPYPGYYAILPTLAALLLIGTGLNSRGPGVLLRTFPLRFLGKISYSLYLWHWPVLIFGCLFFGGPLAQIISPGQAIFLVLLAVLLATLSWFFIEEPIRRGRLLFKQRTLSSPSPGRLIVLGLTAMFLVALLGSQFYWQVTSALANFDQVSNPTGYALPANLRPTLAQAPTDYELPILDACYADDHVTVPDFKRCLYGHSNSHYTIALIGDSHASALFPAVDFVAQAKNWDLLVLVKASCKFVDFPLYNYGLQREYRECTTWNAQVINYLTIHPPNLVIISQEHHDQGLNVADNTASATARGLAQEIAKLPATTRVVIINDPPLPTTLDEPVCLSVYRQDYRHCAFSRIASGTDLGQREVTAAQASGAQILDLTDQICPGSGDCPALINDMIVWRDKSHLTATFARSLGPILAQRLGQILGLN